jgi:hypothetical protein
MAAWARLRKQHPLPWRVVRTVLPQAFEGRAAAVYEEVAAEHPDATEEDLLAQMTVRLYNPQQVSITRGKYERAAQESRESATAFADRIRELASCLPEHTPAAALCSKFVAGVTVDLRREATVADNGDFDELVAKVARLHAVSARRETVGEVMETRQASQGRMQVQGDGKEGSPIGPRQDLKPLMWQASSQCFRCQQSDICVADRTRALGRRSSVRAHPQLARGNNKRRER